MAKGAKPYFLPLIGGGHVRLGAVILAKPSMTPGVHDVFTPAGVAHVEAARWAIAIAATEPAPPKPRGKR